MTTEMASKSVFTSTREKRLWWLALLVVLTILSTLFTGKQLNELLADQNVRAVFFLAGLLLVAGAIIAHAFSTKAGGVEISVLIGIVAVYVMYFLRLGMPERSHLIEFSVLAILIHKALLERVSQGMVVRWPALLSIVLVLLVGAVDESAQLFIPHRYFDWQDIFFNGMAAVFAVGSHAILTWIRKKVKKQK